MKLVQKETIKFCLHWPRGSLHMANQISLWKCRFFSRKFFEEFTERALHVTKILHILGWFGFDFNSSFPYICHNFHFCTHSSKFYLLFFLGRSSKKTVRLTIRVAPPPPLRSVFCDFFKLRHYLTYFTIL